MNMLDNYGTTSTCSFNMWGSWSSWATWKIHPLATYEKEIYRRETPKSVGGVKGSYMLMIMMMLMNVDV